MNTHAPAIWIGDSSYRSADDAVQGGYVALHGEQYYRITHYDQLAPFFMTIVSSADHWLFLASTGGITAGRVNAESALFPYYTVDKITENSEHTGSKAIVLATRGGRTALWEPFSERYAGIYRLERHLYKNLYGNKLLFEELNHDLGLAYSYAWHMGDHFGFIKTAWLRNTAAAPCTLELLDGLQNLLPYGATTALQGAFSNLLDAYKRSELEPQTGLAIFTLNATLTDLAEPSESLKATTVWQVGLAQADYLLCSEQLDAFRHGRPICQETEIRGRRGAYFAHARFDLAGGQQRTWQIVADVNQDSAGIAALLHELQAGPAALAARLRHDIDQGSADLMRIVARADGLQLTGDTLSAARHRSNVLFNVMRGGVFANNYQVDTADLRAFMAARNRAILHEQPAFFAELPATIGMHPLHARAAATGSSDLARLCYEYLPLTFSRRHGDPSRPWNKFAINTKNPDGTRKLDYEGNWRDIFQNWEALAYAYPEFVEGMICTFLNATTADGYNPYRVTRSGVEWEVPEPGNPWSNIGYWSDHQVVYLAKLIEISAKFHPGRLGELLDQRIFSHANVPYRIKDYAALLDDWYATIEFDWPLEQRIAERVAQRGADGKLLLDAEGRVVHATLAEKLLILLLAKLVNLVPEGGIWMNTQRPEWNDANNALVGKGLSVVTVAYLRRYIVLCRHLFAASAAPGLVVSAELGELFHAVGASLAEHQPALEATFSDARRRAAMDALGQAGSAYRTHYYQHGRSGAETRLSLPEVLALLDMAQHYAEHTLHANRRDDGLYHTYNVLRLGKGSAAIDRLDIMLEGQVAILSAGLLTSEQALALLHSLRQSRLYRADQQSYLLYPDRDLPGFLHKNCLTHDQVRGSALVAALVEQGDRSLIVRDLNGVYHFNGSFRNANDARQALARLQLEERYATLVAAEAEHILGLFEQVFQHSAFTGRSGTFFAYEGLGSVYWHMVAKLLLAVQETTLRAEASGAAPDSIQALTQAYYDIRQGLGFNKSPASYGAFPTDPYSHTPAGQGAKQPGMTGQVKEEILTRLGELGIVVEGGALAFKPALLRAQEWTTEPARFESIDIAGVQQTIALPAGALAYSFCQVPIVYISAGAPQITISYADGRAAVVAGHSLSADLSQHIFQRDGQIVQLVVQIAP